jgi:hypothetical protein
MLESERSEAEHRFLGQLTNQMRRQALALPGVLSESPESIPVFTARKAVCLADGLRRLRLWQPTGDFLSTRALDGHIESLAGRSVIVVEDIAASGRGLKRAVDKLQNAGVRIEGAFALSIEGDRRAWETTVGCRFLGTTLSSSPSESLTHTDSVVRAIASLPRPYNVDWPVYQSEKRLTDREIESLSLRPSTDFQSWPRSSARNLELDPQLASRMLSFDRVAVGEIVRRNVQLAKIRVYDFPQSDGAFYVPIFSLGDVSESSLTGLFTALCRRLEVDEPDFKIALKFRVVQFILSDLFFKSATLAFRERFIGDDATNQFLFLPEDREIIVKLQAAVTTLVSSQPPIQRRGSHKNISPMANLLADRIREKAEINLADSILSQKFLAAYVRTEEHSLRETLRAEVRGRERQVIVERLSGLNRVEDGASFRVEDLVQHLSDSPNWSPDKTSGMTQRAVSTFLDRAIDCGEIVPEVIHHDGLLSRRYRSGEIIEFHRERAAVAELVIRTMMAVSGVETISKDLAQKAVIALFRFLLKKQAIVDQRPLKGESPNSLQFRYHLRGVTLSGVEADFVGSRGNPESLNLLEEWGVLVPVGNDGYCIPEEPKLEIGPELESDAVGVGTVIGTMLSLPGDGGKLLMDRNDFSFLVTLVDEEDEVLAIAAEIHIAIAAWRRALPNSVENLRRTHLQQASHQALAKAAWAQKDSSRKLLGAIDKRIGSAFADQGRTAASLLAPFWNGVCVSLQQTGKNSGLNRTLKSEQVWALSNFSALFAFEGSIGDGLSAARCEEMVSNRAFVGLELRLQDASNPVRRFVDQVRAAISSSECISADACDRSFSEIRVRILDEGERLLEEAYTVFARNNLGQTKSEPLPRVVVFEGLTRNQTESLRGRAGVHLVSGDTAGSGLPDGVTLVSLKSRWTSDHLRDLAEFAAEQGSALWFFPTLTAPFQPFLTRDRHTIYIPAGFRDLLTRTFEATQAILTSFFVIQPSARAHEHKQLVDLTVSASIEFRTEFRSWTCSATTWNEQRLSTTNEPRVLSIGDGHLVADSVANALMPLLTSLLHGIDGLRVSAGFAASELQEQTDTLTLQSDSLRRLEIDLEKVQGSLEAGAQVTQEMLDGIVDLLSNASGQENLIKGTLIDFLNGTNASLFATLLFELLKTRYGG